MGTRIPVVDGPTVAVSPRSPVNPIVSEAARPDTAVAQEMQRQGVNFQRMSEEIERMAIFHDENASTDAATDAEAQMRDVMRNDYLTLQHDAAIGSTAAAEKRYTDIQSKAREGLSSRRAKTLLDRKLTPMRGRLKDRLADHELTERRKWSDLVLDKSLGASVARAIDARLGDTGAYGKIREEAYAQIDDHAEMNSISPKERTFRKESYDNMFWSSVISDARKKDPGKASALYKLFGEKITDAKLKSELTTSIEKDVDREGAHALVMKARAQHPKFEDQMKMIEKEAPNQKIRTLAKTDARSMHTDEEEGKRLQRIDNRTKLDTAFFDLVEASADRETMWNWTRGMAEYDLQTHYWEKWQSLSAKSSPSQAEQSKVGLARWQFMTDGERVAAVQEVYAKKGDPTDFLADVLGLRGQDLVTASKDLRQIFSGKVTFNELSVQAVRQFSESSGFDPDNDEDMLTFGRIHAKFKDILQRRAVMNRLNNDTTFMPYTEQLKLLTELSRQDIKLGKDPNERNRSFPMNLFRGEEVDYLYEVLDDRSKLNRILVPEPDEIRIEKQIRDYNDRKNASIPITGETIRAWWVMEMFPMQYNSLDASAKAAIADVLGTGG